MLRSCLCRSSDFNKPFFLSLVSKLKENHDYHRKIWEYVMVTHALEERGCLEEGKKGLGFAVGQEPLPAYFASRKAKILATDLDIKDSRSKEWGDTSQLLTSINILNQREICDSKLFKSNVEYKAVDMNKIPDDLENFDFTWSDCSFEHTGSIKSGLDFVLSQMKTLKSGGWAVHTTELNLTSNKNTIEKGITVLFRKRDIMSLVKELRRRGHYVAPISWKLDNSPYDKFIDYPPYQHLPHLKAKIGDFVTTSIMLIIQKDTQPKWRKILRV